MVTKLQQKYMRKNYNVKELNYQLLNDSDLEPKPINR